MSIWAWTSGLNQLAMRERATGEAALSDMWWWHAPTGAPSLRRTLEPGLAAYRAGNVRSWDELRAEIRITPEPAAERV